MKRTAFLIAFWIHW